MNMDHPAYAIETRGLDYAYPQGVKALEQIDLQVLPGQMVALLGANGSGKTTLIKILAGLLKPARGRVKILGERPGKDLHNKIGLVFQNPQDQLFASTVEEDVAFGPRNLGLDEAEVQRRVHSALESVGASALCRRSIHHLSLGEQKRVAIAGILAMEPGILMLDEPTAGLDPAGEIRMMTLLQRLNREKSITVLMATHAVDLLPLFADRIMVMHKGFKKAEGAPAEIFSNARMLEETGLRPPYIAELFQALENFSGPAPLTIREAKERVLEFMMPRESSGGKS